jgi:alpha-galactosidase
MRRPSLLISAAVAALALLPAGVILRGEQPLVQVDDAVVTVSDDGRTWTIGDGLIQYSLGSDGQTVGVRRIHDVISDLDWQRTDRPDTFATIGSQRIEIGSAATPLVGFSATEWWGGVRLDLRYQLSSPSMLITRSYACYPGSSVIETWTTFQNQAGTATTLSDLTNFAFGVNDGTVRWLTGIRGPAQNGGPFTLNEGDLDDGQVFQVSQQERASQDFVPWFAIRLKDPDAVAKRMQFFGSVLWPGQWLIRATREGTTDNLQVGMPTFHTTLGGGASIETPHAVFGLTNAVVPEPSLALRSFIDKGLRHGRPIHSYVSYNTWFLYGTIFDEAAMFAEMDAAAAMGLEQFVVDAGWWLGASSTDPGDFVTNWGNWQVDPVRFPNGLEALSDHAHALGMRFGIWVEPERVYRGTVDEPGLARERYLATVGGRYDPSVPNTQAQSAQICLADSAARKWVLSELLNLIARVRPDYLKWDNNMWVNCDRIGHGHTAEDGNFAHMRGLHTVLDQLRQVFPDLDIENCSSGGNRMSLDLLAYSENGWMDDNTSSSGLVRHNLEGLSTLFPPSYLQAFAISSLEEPISEDPSFDLLRMLRSRMAGSFTGAWRVSEISGGSQALIARQVSLYKAIRPVLDGASTILLQPQYLSTPDQAFSGWDVMEQVVGTTGDALIFAFETADAPDGILLTPKALRPDATYDVESADYGALGSATGSDLMSSGISVSKSPLTRSHILVLHARGGTTPAAARRVVRKK